MDCGIDDEDVGVSRGRGIDDVSEGSDIWGQRWKLWSSNDGTEELATTTVASVEEDEPEVSTTTTEASDDEAEDTTCPSERLRRRRRRCDLGLRVLKTTTASSAE